MAALICLNVNDPVSKSRPLSSAGKYYELGRYLSVHHILALSTNYVIFERLFETTRMHKAELRRTRTQLPYTDRGTFPIHIANCFSFQVQIRSSY